MTCGDRIRFFRMARKLSQEDLATQTGLPITAISKIEHGTRKVALEEAARIAEVLGVRMEALLSDVVPEPYHDPWLVSLHEHMFTIPKEYCIGVAEVLESLATGYRARALVAVH